MEVRGVRSSWLTMPRNSARSRSSSSSGVMSCRVTTTDSTSPSSERMGVALTRVVTLRPSGASRTISSARTVSPVLSPWARGNSSRETSRPSARRKVSMSRSCSAEPSGIAQAADDPPRLPVDRHRVPRLRVEDQDAHGSGVHQGLQVGPGPLLLPVPAGVGDDQRRLGGEHHQGLLVFGVNSTSFSPDVEGPDALPQGGGWARQEREAACSPPSAVETPEGPGSGCGCGSPADAAAPGCC